MLLQVDVSDGIVAFSGGEVKDCKSHACAGDLDWLDACAGDLANFVAVDKFS